MAFENITKEGNFRQSATGDYGFRYLTTGGNSAEGFRAIQALTSSVVTTTTSVGDALTSVTINAGTVIYGKFDSVNVVSGAVIAYKSI